MYSLRSVVSLAVVAVALTLSACGSDGGSDDAADTVASSTEAPPPVAPIADPARKGGPKADVAEVINDVQESLLTGDGAGVCRELTATAQEKAAGGGTDCPAAVEKVVAGWRDEGKTAILSRVVSVKIDGEEATATLSDDSHGTYDVKVVNVGGGLWLLTDVDLGDPTGMSPIS